MLFESKHPDIHPPTDLTVWSWLFENPSTSPLHRFPAHELAGYTNAVTRERINWAQVRECATHISTALTRKYGLREEQTVALFSHSTVWYPVAMFAAVRAGAKVAGASPAYNVEEMTYALKVSDAKFLMTSPSCIEVASASAQQAGIPREHIFLLEGEVPGYTTLKQLQEMGKAYGDGGGATEGQIPWYRVPEGKTNAEICGFLNFSSGTTGLPKAVMLSHHNIIAQVMQAQAVSVPGRKTALGVLPLFHVTGLIRFINTPVFFNDEMVLLPQFNLEHMLNAMVEYQVAEVSLVPPLVIRLVNDPLVDKYDLSCLRRLSSGAAPLSEQLTHQLQRKFPHIGFRQGYGMTESTACITCHSPQYYDYKYANTVGDIVPSTVVRIIDVDDGTELGYNQPGEILAQGPQIAMGYLGNAAATAESFDRDGFLHTGDIGSINDEGLIVIHDRIKEMIKVKGIAVAPAELEDVLLGHPHVDDCAVMGVPDDYAGERPKAYVVPAPGGTMKPSDGAGRELMQYVRERKVRFKWLGAVEFVDAVPKSASGKILRRVLKDKERRGEHGLVVRDERERARL